MGMRWSAEKYENTHKEVSGFKNRDSGVEEGKDNCTGHSVKVYLWLNKVKNKISGYTGTRKWYNKWYII